MPASAWIINLVVLGVVLETDLGRRRITWFRLARPLLAAGAVIAYYLISTPMAARGGGLALELALAALGVILGVAAGMIFSSTAARTAARAARPGSPTPRCGSWSSVPGSGSPTPPATPTTCRRGWSPTTSPPPRSPTR